MGKTTPKPVRAPAPPKPTAKARKLARELQEAQLEAQLIRTRQGLRRLKESAALDYDWVGPWSELLRQRTEEPGWAPIGSLSARGKGAQFPFYQTEQELAVIRDLSRIVAGTNGNAIGLLRGYTAFAIGTGFKTKVSARPGADPGAAKGAVGRVTAWLDGWERLNNWGERQQELFRRTERDGDGALRLFPDNGALKVRFVWPEQITQPPGSTFEEYGFGIRWARLPDADDGEGDYDPECIDSVYVAHARDPGRGDHVSGEDIVLFQPECDTGVKRRLPLFSFQTREALDTAGRLTRNLGEGSAVRAAIAYMRQHATADESEVEAFRDAEADFRETRRTERDTYTPVTKDYPGMVVDIPEGLAHVPPPVNSDTAAASAVVDLLLRSASARINAPEWLASSNAANMGAYTSSLVAESPFVKGIVSVQGYYRARLLRVVERALELAAASGLIRPGDLELVAVDLVPPSPEARDKDKESQRAKTEIELGVDSRQRYCESQDRDYERVQRENKEWAEQNPPQQPPPGGAPGPVQAPAPPAPPNAPEVPALESLLESEEPRLTGDQYLELLESGHVLLEAGSNLVPKKITVTKANGTTYQKTVMVKPAQAKPDPKKAKADAKGAAAKAIGDAYADPANTDLGALAAHLKNLTVGELASLKKQSGLKGGKTKQELIDKITAHLQDKATPKPPSPPPPPPPPTKADLKAAAKQAVSDAFANPAAPVDLNRFPDLLKQLTVPELKALGQ
ncbi:MAG TPA: hypothetical protein VGE74_13065, partial [Gemmata sp.]